MGVVAWHDLARSFLAHNSDINMRQEQKHQAPALMDLVSSFGRKTRCLKKALLWPWAHSRCGGWPRHGAIVARTLVALLVVAGVSVRRRGIASVIGRRIAANTQSPQPSPQFCVVVAHPLRPPIRPIGIDGAWAHDPSVPPATTGATPQIIGVACGVRARTRLALRACNR